MKVTLFFLLVAVLLTIILAVAAAREVPRGMKEEEVVGECPPVDGPSPVYLMDKRYRNVFYECNSGRPIRQRCPTGLVFDPRKNVCDYPSTECKPYGPVGSCPNDNIKPYPHELLRDGANVSVYYYCRSQKDIEVRNCKKGEYFDTIDKVCKVFSQK